MRTRRTVYSFFLLLAALLSLATPWLFPACEGLIGESGMPPMRCLFTYRVEWVLGLALVLVALSSFGISEGRTRRSHGLLVALLGAIAAVVPRPWIIGTCRMGTCHLGGLWYTGLGALLILFGGLGVLLRTSTATEPVLDDV